MGDQVQLSVPLQSGVVDEALLQATAANAAGVQAAMAHLLQMSRTVGSIQQQVQQISTVTTDVVAEVSILRKQVETQVGLGSSASRKLQKAVGNRVHVISLDTSQHPQHFANLYGGLKDYFDVSSYRDIPRVRFEETMKLVEMYDGTTRHWWSR